MKSAVLIGNGLSREGLHLPGLEKHGRTIGCNWIFSGGWPGEETREPYIPDTVVTIDTPPQHEITKRWGTAPPFNHLAQNAKRTHVLLNRRVLCPRPKGPFWNNSGVFGLWYALEWLKAERVYLVGVDFFRPSERRTADGKRTNDMYGIYTQGVTVHRCYRQLAEAHPDREIVRIGPWEHDREFYETNIAPCMRLQESL